uniref:Uncharacterized protein n=1 Tax=Arundo donax TaxID=35708 RepID=A0A0A8ZB41_ARUDO
MSQLDRWLFFITFLRNTCCMLVFESNKEPSQSVGQSTANTVLFLAKFTTGYR